MESRYKGKSALFLRNVFIYVLLSTPVLSLCLMGAAWIHLFLSMMALSLILLPAAAFLVSRMDGFSFDDQKQAFRRTFGREIPYSGIQRVDVNETSGLVQVVLKRGRIDSVTLISTLPKSAKPGLIEELKTRLPGVEIRERYHQDWKSLAIVGALLLSATAAFHGYLYAEHPAIAVQPQLRDWTETGKAKGRTQEYRAGGYLVSLPEDYRYQGREGEMLFFEDRVKGRNELKIISSTQEPLFGRKRRLLALLTGIGDYAHVLETAYDARYGIVPLVLKDFALAGMNDIRLFSVKQREFKGIITQGAKRGKESTHILIAGNNGRQEINFFISGPSRMEEQELRKLVAGIQHRPE